MKHKIKITPVGAQKEFLNDDKTKFLHLSAGYGFGKTYTLCIKMLKLSRLNAGLPGGLICPSYTDFNRDVRPTMEDILTKWKIPYRYHETRHFFKLPWTAGNMYIATAEKKLRGPNWAYAGINELTLIKLERYKEVIGRVRLRGAKFPQIVSSGTPEGMASDYYQIFVEQPWENSKCLYGDTRQNSANLNQDYIKQLENSYDSVMLDAYMRGLWVNMNGSRFYYAYDSNRNDKPYQFLGDEDYKMVHCFMDFNVEHMTCTLWFHEDGKLRGFDEIVIKQNADTNKMAQALISRGYTPDRTIIYPDPAGQARSTKGQPDVQILRNNGFSNIRVKPTQPQFRQRQLNVNNLLEKGLIVIDPVRQPTLKKDLLSVEQDPTTFEKLKSNPKLTHASDGLDYGVDWLYPFSGTRSKPTIVQYR